MAKERSNLQEPSAGAQAPGLKAYSPLQSHYLMRLQRLKEISDLQQITPGIEPWLQNLLSRAIYSTLCDCIDYGMGDEAHQVLSQEAGQPN